MRTVVINTSKEAKNTKLDVLFKAPFDQNSLLWIDSRLSDLGEKANVVKQSLIEDSDTIDKDYQLIVLVDLYPFPLGNDKKAVELYQMLMEKYIRCSLLEALYSQLDLGPLGVSLYFVDSAKEIRGLDLNALASNAKEQEEQTRWEQAEKEKYQAQVGMEDGEDISDEEPRFDPVSVPATKPRQGRPEDERILMEIFSWGEGMRSNDFHWDMNISADGEESLDFSNVFAVTSASIARSHETAEVLEIALQEVLAPQERSNLFSVGRFPVYSLVCPVVRDNEQSKIEGFFGVFANIFTCVQEKVLLPKVLEFTKEEIERLLVDALKKYRYFSLEENIQLKFEPIAAVFAKRKAIYDKRKKEARNRSKFKDMTDEQVAELVMSEGKPLWHATDRKLRGLDRAFYEQVEAIFSNYDTEVIQSQNNLIVKNCLEGLWSWRDKQTAETFKGIVNAAVSEEAGFAMNRDDREQERDKIDFIEEEYEAKRNELINAVTDAEHKLASNKNVLLKAKDLVLQYGDWMRKGKWSWISCIGAIFTVLATVFPFFYTEVCAGSTGLGFQVNLLLIVGFCAFLYAVAASAYLVYINRKKAALLFQLEDLQKKSQEERKASIIALYQYYNDTVVEAESHYLLWREILRRDRENAKKGIKRNYHIKRLKSLIEQVERFITMLKIDVDKSVKADKTDLDRYDKLGLRLNGEESFYEKENRRVYCILPEKDETVKGGTEEA